MDGIELMVQEHLVIKRVLKVVRNIAYKILQGEEICYDDFEKIIDFIRNFADSHHHAKEEKFLFNKMMDELGEVAVKLVRHGMLVEHDLGRLYIQQLEEALAKVKAGDDFEKINVIANAVGYTNLLERHIDKEDGVVYTFAKKQLKAEVLDVINGECEAFEDKCKADGIQDKYIRIVEHLEGKYL